MEKKKKEYVRIIVLAVCTFVLMLSAIFSSPISAGIKKLLFKTDVKICDDELVVHFIDVGQGDASVITFPNGQNMMIDAGPKSRQNLLIDYMRDNVFSSTKNYIIDYLVLTHPDADHSGGMCAVFENFKVKNFYRPNIASIDEDDSEFAFTSDVNEYNEVINTSNNENGLTTKIINQNYTLLIDDVKVEMLAPLKIYSTTNSMSPVIKVSYLDNSLLFAGDIQKDAESDMVAEYATLLDADVLKVAHHGSNTSNSDQFIAQVSPIYSVISADKPNSYGHPSYETITTLQKYNTTIIQTHNNMVRFTIGDQGLELLDTNVTISTLFIEWKVIAIILASILTLIIVVLIIKLARYNNRLI